MNLIEKGKNAEIQQKIEEQAKQGNAYFDAEALIEYFRQNLINYGNDINSGMSNGNVTLQILEIPEKMCSGIYRELQMNSGHRYMVRCLTEMS